jgi:hypothetical protein
MHISEYFQTFLKITQTNEVINYLYNFTKSIKKKSHNIYLVFSNIFQ